MREKENGKERLREGNRTCRKSREREDTFTDLYIYIYLYIICFHLNYETYIWTKRQKEKKRVVTKQVGYNCRVYTMQRDTYTINDNRYYWFVIGEDKTLNLTRQLIYSYINGIFSIRERIIITLYHQIQVGI